MSLKISYIGKNSILRQYGIKKGDTIMSINGRNIYNFEGIIYESEFDKMLLGINTKGINVEIPIKRNDYYNINTEFEETPILKCKNNCIFCFINQNPKKLRQSLYIKDDDYRLTLHYGNYITLSNLSDNELRDIVEHQFTPMYVSIHAIENDIRKKIFGTENSIDKLLYLLKNNINIHAQIVLVPDLNDSKHLVRTMEFAKKNRLLSLGIVPCGLTKFREHLPKIKPINKIYAKKIINLVESWKKKNVFKDIYLSDEFFLNAEMDIPKEKYYDNYPQIDNGIGMIRQFLEETSNIKNFYLKNNYAMVTGELFGKFLKRKNYFNDNSIYTAENNFFGKSVNVTGLLTGKDIIKTGKKINEKNILLWYSIFNDDGLTLDSMKKSDIERALSKRVIIINEYNEIGRYLKCQ